MEKIKIPFEEKKIYENTTVRLPKDVITFYDMLVMKTGLSRNKLMEIALSDGMKRIEVTPKEE